MAGILSLLAWSVIVLELLLGVELVRKAAAQMEQGFQADYAMQACGRYLALAANMQDAVTTWRKMGCGKEEEVEPWVEDLLEDWRARYPGMDPDRCAEEGPLSIKLHRQRNPLLDADYPNWVVSYE